VSAVNEAQRVSFWNVGFMVAFLASVVLGYVGIDGFLAAHPTVELGRQWSDVLYYDLQLFVLGSSPLEQPGPYGLALEVARFLAPFTTVLAGVEALKVLAADQLQRWRAAVAWQHAIVVGDLTSTLPLARRLVAAGRQVVVVTPASDLAVQARRERLLAVVGDPGEPVTLRAAGVARAAELFACCRNATAANVAVALAARSVRRRQRRPLTAYANVRDGELWVGLRADRIGMVDDPYFRLEFFTVEDVAARVLLDRLPGFDEQRATAHALLVGFGPFSRAVLAEIARRVPEGGPAVPVTVIVPHGEEELREHLSCHPGVERSCTVTFKSSHTAAGALEGVDQIVVALPDDESTFRVAVELTHRIVGSHVGVTACVENLSPFGDAVGEARQAVSQVYGRLAVFGVLVEGGDPQRVRDDLVDRLARAIHADYVAQGTARGETPQTNPSLVAWAELPPDLQASNRAQATDIGIKLQNAGCAVVPAIGPTPRFVFCSRELEVLARGEHERWMAERLSRGFRYGPVRTAQEHPDLLPWGELSEPVRDKDRDAVRRIPDLLARLGYTVIRLDQR
jgi:hypothetical protein